MKNMLSLYAILLVLGCRKDPLPPPPPVPHTKLQIVWQVPITPDTSEYSTQPHAMIGGDIAYFVNFYAPSGFAQLRDGSTGQLKWKFDAFNSSIDGLLEGAILNVGDKLVVNNWGRTYCIDGQSGQLDWELNAYAQGGSGEPLITSIGDYIYKANFEDSPPKITSASVVRTHYLQGRWDTLLTIAAEDSFHLNIAPPTLWVNPQGDSVLFIRDNGLRDVLATPWEGRYNLVSLSAWNMRTRQYEWKIKDFLDQFAVMQRPPIVEGDRAYFLTSGALHGFDLVTGTRAWSRPLPNVAIHAGIVQHGDYIIAQSSYDGMWAVDKSNGAIRWHNPKTYGTPTLLSYFDGVAYFTSTGSSRLWAVNAETGQTIWDEPSPNAFSPRTPNAGFDFANVVIDPVRRVLYTADKYYMMCIKLPE